MKRHKLPVKEMTSLVNEAIDDLTGHYGTVHERHIYKLLNGEHRSPNALLRTVLENVTGLPAAELGFVPRGSKNSTRLSPAPEDDPLYRRTFMAAAAAAGASLTAPSAKQRRLGSADVDRMNAKLAAVVSMDNKYGGTEELQRHAAALAKETVDLQNDHIASSRIRSELYGVAAAFTASAMWAAIDGRRLTEAEPYLNRAVTLAGLANNRHVLYRVWGHAGIMYRHLGRPADAIAAAEAARSQSITRTDPLYASLALARIASFHADRGDERGAERAIGMAQTSFERADMGKHRPPWMGFFDQAELDSLATFAYLRLGKWEEAERYAHRCLAGLRPGLERNRALTYANLALAQLGQGDIEPAVATARTVPAPMAGHGRVNMLLNDFTTRLTAVAPRSSETSAWLEHRRAAA
ncbi:Tat pathway signal protein [Streptomyces pacificus]|uniref:Tat pathway signal protein n=1 Tax=Streptomyces pacificus TaxID=2705029 RepID=A0A6A0AU55_9ACTN|nr:Tat pathway signal protein [Streptomyces pacificus]GFH35137.1 Tat pathway signal protein [Streptomyces pacificus]